MSQETQTQIEDNTDKPLPVSGDDLAAPLVDGMPAPSGSSVANESSSAIQNPPPVTTPPNEFPNAVDSSGQKFDPLQHRIDEQTGQPKLNKKGRFIGLNFGRPAGSTAEKKNDAQQTRTVIPGETPPLPAGNLPDEFELAARAYVETGTGAACVLISDEWAATKEETEWLTKSVANYLRAKGDIDLSPGQLCALAIAAYAGKRAQMPKTQEKLKTWGQKLKGMFGKNSS